MTIQTVSLIGLGALGIMYADKLSQALPYDKLRIIADKARITRYQQEGIYCNDKLCHFNYIEPNVAVEPCDLLIIATKFNGLEHAIEAVRSQVGEHTIIISLLNGVSSEQYLIEQFGEGKILYCVAQGMDATKTANRLHYNSSGLLCFGVSDPQYQYNVSKLAEFLTRMNIAYEISSNIIRHLWSKFMFNVGVNQVIAVYGGHYANAQQEGPVRQTMIAAMNEVRLISEKNGINLTQQDIEYWLKVLTKLGPAGDPSMRQDVDAKRVTEVELFAGSVIHFAKKYAIAVPVNEQLYQQIKHIEATY